MAATLIDLSPASLIRAMEGNLAAWAPIFNKLGQEGGASITEVTRAITPVPSGLFNSIFDARLAPEQVDPAIQAILIDARQRNSPLLWWIGPSTKPADLGERLLGCGFAFDGAEPGMAIDFSCLNDGLPVPNCLAIRRVEDASSFRLWSEVMMRGFENPAPNPHVLEAWADLLRLAEQEAMHAYLGWLDDKPAATTLLFLAAGVAGIYAVATVPEARRKGIGACMVQHALLDACSRGYRAGVLQASEMGIGVYKSLGFREVCKIHVYRWSPEIGGHG